jgi:hypothetical protein
VTVPAYMNDRIGAADAEKAMYEMMIALLKNLDKI